MTPGTNLAHAFGQRVDEHPEMPAIIARDMTISYGKLRAISDVFTWRMHALGIGPGATVAIDTSDVIVALSAMFASARLGGRFVGLNQDLLQSQVVTPTHFLRSPDRPPRDGIDAIEMDRTWSPKFAPELAGKSVHDLGFADSDQPWWILHTSGTTGGPKFMELSQGAVHDRSIAARVDFTPNKTRFCSLFGCNLRPFYVRTTAALLNGCTIVDSADPEFLASEGVDLICGAPLQSLNWLRETHTEHRFARLQVSGKRLNKGDAKELLSRFDVVEDVYGSSETNKSFLNVNTLRDGRVHTVGRPADSQVEIVDDANQPVAAGGEGAVRIRNRYMASAYIGDPVASELVFRDGWFYPGDRAVWSDAGALCIVSRSDALVNIGGQKIDPEVAEHAMLAVDGVTGAAYFADPRDGADDQALAFLMLANRATADQTVPAAHAACVAATGQMSAPQHIIVIDKIPTTLDGTPRRSECAKIARELPDTLPSRTARRPKAESQTNV